MTSKALLGKAHAKRHLFLWTLKKNSIIVAIVSLLSLIIQPGFLLLDYFNSLALNLAGLESEPNYIYTCTIGHIFMSLLTALLIALLFSMNFNYLHSKKASDMFNSLPVKRSSLMLCRFFATLTGILIPVVISSVSEFVALAFIRPDDYSLVDSLSHTALFILLIFAASAMAMLFTVVCGTTFDFIGSLAAVNIGWSIMYLLFQAICSLFLVGYTFSDDYGVYIFSPFVAMLFKAADGISPYSAIYWVVFIIVAFLLSILLVKHRKNEASGHPYAYKSIGIVVQVIIATVASFLLGAIFSLGKIGSVAFYIFMVIGALLGSVIYGAIATRGFKTIGRSVITAAVCCVLIVGGILTAKYDITGYNMRVPSPENIKSVDVTISHYSYDDDLSYTTFSDDGIYSEIVPWYTSYIDRTCTLSEQESIEKAIALHQELLSSPETKPSSLLSPDATGDSGFSVKYTLNNGLTVSRSYHFLLDTEKEEFFKLLTSRELIEKSDPLVKYESKLGEKKPDFISMDVYNSDWSEYASYNLKSNAVVAEHGDLFKKISVAYKKDLSEITEDNYSGIVLYTIDFQSNSSLYFFSPDYLSLEILSSYKNTLSVLSEEGILDDMTSDGYMY